MYHEWICYTYFTGRETVIYNYVLNSSFRIYFRTKQVYPNGTKMVGSNLWDEGAP